MNSTASKLNYPFTQEPGVGDGSAVQVAPGVLWLRMPLFAALAWINVWAVRETDGWSVIDTGLHSQKSIAAWELAFAGVLEGAPITRVIVTHMHPDHCGMAGWMTERFGIRLWMSRLEYFSCRLMAADTGSAAPAEGIDFYRACGWDETALEHYRQKFGWFGEHIYALPAAYRRIADEDTLQLGAHQWTVIVGNGHSPEHACLYCPEIKVLVSGDQILPRISSNVSVYPLEPDADPLSDWINSLAKLKARIPDEVTVLPAHNSPFNGLHARIDELSESHASALERLLGLLREPKRAVDVFGALFSRPITGGLLGMATGEAMAHLNHLTHLGLAVRALDEQGVWIWRRTGRGV